MSEVTTNMTAEADKAFISKREKFVRFKMEQLVHFLDFSSRTNVIKSRWSRKVKGARKMFVFKLLTSCYRSNAVINTSGGKKIPSLKISWVV